ncbi:cobyrinate a,c-diamide synthase [Tumidithrix elongata RA019]|uniref:Cobyrinate a,c-diamide synthase n=1 Tax=Tumidithrix elongata BACA0141 TaxID=2716417 RepID=A0AAW9PZK0_9CYAN|nr:cobyrinate a,c-diamide synthase [Tumidithrix elongata RA019]
MAIALAGTHSGVGKTTVTLAILSALREWGMVIQSFKVGPDYIDPMFHTAITGRPCRNLDPVLTSPNYVRDCFAKHSASVDGAVIEGVMGLFDGAGSDEFASTAHIAKLLDRAGESISVILVVDCSRMSRSLAATLYGYQNFDPDLNLAGVILNRVGSDLHREILTEAIAPLGIPILGVIPRSEGITLSDRHLGLIPTDEVANFSQISAQLADLGRRCLDWQKLMPLISSKGIPRNLSTSPTREVSSELKIEIAVARDRAFNFYYADNLDILQELGAELVYWSPLSESQPPVEVQGLYFGGGFPEVFAKELSENQAAIAFVRQAASANMPIYAECGGLMYLSEAIANFSGQSFEMVGVLPTKTAMTQKLTLGYRQCALHQNSSQQTWLPSAPIWGHEFHRSIQTTPTPEPLFDLTNYAGTNVGVEGWGNPHLLATYIHLHWGGNPTIPQRFIEACESYQHSVASLYKPSRLSIPLK